MAVGGYAQWRRAGQETAGRVAGVLAAMDVVAAHGDAGRTIMRRRRARLRRVALLASAFVGRRDEKRSISRDRDAEAEFWRAFTSRRSA